MKILIMKIMRFWNDRGLFAFSFSNCKEKNRTLVNFLILFNLFWTLISNQNSKFKNSRCRIEIRFILLKLGTWGFSRSLLTNLNSKFRNSKFWMQYGGLKCKLNWFDYAKTRQTGVFDVAYYESELKIHKLKMSDLIWRPKILKVTRFRWNSILEGIRRRWLQIATQNSEIQNFASTMADRNAKFIQFRCNPTLGGFRYYEFEAKIEKFWISVPIWRPKF